MIVPELLSYPVTKDSGFPWLGQVPEHWEVLPAKRALHPEPSGGAIIKNTAAQTRKDGYVPAFSASGQDIWLQSPSHHGDALVLSAVGARCGRTFRASGEWGVVANTHVLRPQANQNRDYWWYVTNNQEWWERAGAAQPFVRVRATLDRPWTFPGPEEQRAIARFLAYADQRIQRYIHTKKRLIELLEEEKQAIIHRAVTGQVDVRTGQRYPTYKSSGVEWLGEIPVHWEVRRLKYLTPRITVGIVVTPAKYYVDQGVPCLRSLNVSGGVVDMEDLVFISESANELHKKSKIFRGDVVVVRTGQAGTAAVVPEELDGANCIDLLIVRYSERLLSRFVYYYLNSRTSMSQATAQSVGAIQTHYNTSTLAQLVFPKVPLEEQDRIVSYLDKGIGRIDHLVALAKQTIARFEEYRTALIAAIVTGRLDVREAAASLPESDASDSEEHRESGADIALDSDALEAIAQPAYP